MTDPSSIRPFRIDVTERPSTTCTTWPGSPVELHRLGGQLTGPRARSGDPSRQAPLIGPADNPTQRRERTKP